MAEAVHDELVEVSPKSLRMRKRILDTHAGFGLRRTTKWKKTTRCRKTLDQIEQAETCLI